MRIKLVRKGRWQEIEFDGGTIAEVIQNQGLNEETFVIVLNDRIAHPSQRLREGDVLELVEVIYGG